MKEHPNSKFHKQDLATKAHADSPLEAMAALNAIHKLENVAKGADQLKELRKRLTLNHGFESASE